MANEKRLIDANALLEIGRARKIIEVVGNWKELPGCAKSACVRLGIAHKKMILDAPTVDAVEVPCRCCDCYYLLNGKNGFGLYFYCGHPNGLKNLRNTEKDFCPYAANRWEVESDG